MKKKNTPVRQSHSHSSSPGSSSPGLTLSRSSAEWASSVRLAGRFSQSLHQQHRSLSQAQVLAFIRQRIPRQWGSTEVVGQWVWVHLSRELLELERAWLFELGFHFSPPRRAYQHPCGVSSSPSREPFVKYFPAAEAAQFAEFAPHF